VLKIVYISKICRGRETVRGLAMINLSNKCEVSISTKYEYMKEDTKCENWGGLGYLWVTGK